MSGSRHRPVVVLGLGAFAFAAACTTVLAQAEASKADADVAAYIGSDPISLKDLDAKVLKTNTKLAQSLYDARVATLNDLLIERILAPEAKEKSLSVELLLRQKLAEKSKPVTDAEVEAFFNSKKAQMGGKTLEQMSGQIKTYLASQAEATAKSTLVTELKQKAGVKVVLGPPRVEVVVSATDPSKGPAGAKVTIVEYSDFQ